MLALLRTLFAVLTHRIRVVGGHLPAHEPRHNSQLYVLSPSALITDPDEAEALGLTRTQNGRWW